MRLQLLLGFFLGFAPGAAVGIGRFAYALVLPEMQQQLGLSYAQAGYIGSSNTAGYLIGALISHHILYKLGYKQGLFLCLFLQTASLLLLSLNLPLSVMMLLRFTQGFLGACVFVGGATLILASGGKGTATGLYFSGVGIGILVSPIILPLMKSWQQGWLLLGILSLIFSLMILPIYKYLKEPAVRNKSSAEQQKLSQFTLILIAYGLYGLGYIGYMTFITSSLQSSIMFFWLILGIGATSTGIFWSPIISKVGGKLGLSIILLTLASSSFYVLVQTLPWLSAFMFGISFLGVITAITNIFREELKPSEWARAMAYSTASFALGQALGPSLSGISADLLGSSSAAIQSSSVFLFLAFAFSIFALFRRKTPAAFLKIKD